MLFVRIDEVTPYVSRPLSGQVKSAAGEKKRLTTFGPPDVESAHNLAQLEVHQFRKLTQTELRVTKDTELGDNEDIRTPKPQPITPFPNRKKCGE